MENYYMTEEQQSIILLLRDILQKELAPRVSELDNTGEFPRDVFEKIVEAGLFALTIPEEYGGLGVDHLTLAMVNEEYGKVDAGFGLTMTLGGDTFNVVDGCEGSEEQKRYVAEKLLNGSLGAICITEPGAGSDAGAMRTTAVRDGDEWVLNGTKCFITNGAVADLFVVFAVTDKSMGTKGISAFLVEKKHGLQVGKIEEKMGLHGSNTTDIIMEDVRIPAANLLGKEGSGYKYCLKYLETVRCLTMAFTLGIAQTALDHAVKYAKERVQFGMPIIKNQGLGFMLADMQIDLCAARALMHDTCRMMDLGYSVKISSPASKVFVSEKCFEICNTALQVLGGYGYMKEYPVEKLLRDSRVFPIFEGTNEIQKVVIHGHLSR